MADNDRISEALGIRPISEAKQDLDEMNKINPDLDENLPIERDARDETMPAIIEEEDEHQQDLELARQNIKNIIEMGDDAIAEMVEIAKQSESPRAFEVVSTLMKTLLDANKDYVDVSSKKKFEKGDKPQQETNVTNNNLIVSTADLLKMIKGEGDA